MTNPLLDTWDTPYGVPPYDRITDADYGPAIDAALAEARAATRAIADQAEPATFANTIEALEGADRTLDHVLAAFFSAAGADSNSEREALMREISPKLAAYGSEVTMNPDLFARIETLWQGRDALDLGPEQARLLEVTGRNFVRAGAQLEGADRDRLAAIKERLASLGTQFTQNLLADERGWQMAIPDDVMADLPDYVADAARAAGTDGPVVTLSRSLIVPFLQTCPRRDLREAAFKAWAARGAGGGETDNRAIAREILELRAERARLLGFDTFADYKLAPEMAGTPQAVRDLLMAVWRPAVAKAGADADALSALMREDGLNGDLEPWDWRFYAERRRQREHDLNEGEIKPYFQLDRMIAAAFDCANRLFGLEAREVDAPLYHPDCRAWDISRNGRHMALLVTDYFARPSKRSGAWCGAMRGQSALDGEVRPIVTNVCNFAKPAAGQPALLSYDDARTLFHEFGHALHHILSDVTYASLSGTSVSRDFVELPSQLFEHWLEVPEVLDTFATHARTGKPIPADLRDRLLAARNLDQGFATVEYLGSALVDLEFHDGAAPSDLMGRQAEILAGIGMPQAIGMRHASPHFAHVFAGDGYSSAYYSYMWSEMLDADAFAAFEAAGGAFDGDTASALERDILSRGGSEPPADLYTRFRGRMPDVGAILAGRGLDAA